MPLKKDIQEPPPKKRKASGEAPPKKAEVNKDDPWKILPDGSKVRQGRKLPYENKLHTLFKELAGAVTLADSFSGEIIKRNSEELAYGYALLVQENDAVKAFVANLTAASSYGAVIIPTAMTAVPILWHFGLMPARFGVPATVMSGMPLVTRAQEQAYKDRVQKEQARAAAAEAQKRATHPQGEGTGDGDQPSD